MFPVLVSLIPACAGDGLERLAVNFGIVNRWLPDARPLPRQASRAGRKQLINAAMTPAELEGIIGMTITQVLSGAKSPGIGNAVASLARASIAIREATELEQRVSELETTLGIKERTA